MIFKRLRIGAEVSDADFDSMYSNPIRAVSEFHFTPVEVAIAAARFLVQKPGERVLDVGAGAGKFCLIGASCTPGRFTGVEQRAQLHELSELLSKNHGVSNTRFVHSNILEIDFRQYDAIYFFNSFSENIFQKNPIDKSVKLDKALYQVYARYMREQLDSMPVGTRLATYFSYLDEVPNSYVILETGFDRKLKLWVKTI